MKPVGRPLARRLGLRDVYVVSTGAMFSSGFFLLPGIAAGEAGPAVFLAYLLAGLLVLPGVLSTAEMATAMPRAGGEFYFLDRSMGPLAGTIAGIGTWVALVFKSAFALVGMSAYLAIYVDVPIEPIALVFAAGFVVLNIVGAREATSVQAVLVAVLLGVLVFFLIAGSAEIFRTGAGTVRETQFTPFLPFGVTGLLGATALVFVSYVGLTQISAVAGEIRDPGRNIPLGMLLAIATATAVYVLGVAVMVGVLEPAALRDDLAPVATAAEALPWLPVVLVVGAAIAAFVSTANAGILAASRYPLAMARDDLVIDFFQRRLGRPVPVVSIVATGVVIVGAILLLDVEGIARMASAFILLLLALLCVAVLILRRGAYPEYQPQFRAPFAPWLQVGGVLVSIVLIAMMGLVPVLFTAAVVLAAATWYAFYGRHHQDRKGAIEAAVRDVQAGLRERIDNQRRT
jgi:basic amino acid/polyamine antiporter, APA family